MQLHFFIVRIVLIPCVPVVKIYRSLFILYNIHTYIKIEVFYSLHPIHRPNVAATHFFLHNDRPAIKSLCIGSKTRLSLGGETLTPASAAAIAGSRLSLAGLTGTSRRRAKDPDLDTSSRMSLASSSTSRLGAADLRELALLRELDALREVNMAASSDLGASRLSLAPSDLSSRYNIQNRSI